VLWLKNREIGMNSAAQNVRRGSEFDKFLFTLLGDDQNGLPLSIVSLLARMNVDPWQEAGTLDALPAEAAVRRLTFSLDTLTDPKLRQAISETRVLRLLALLPRQAPAAVQTPVASANPVVTPRPWTRIRTIIFIATAIVLVGSQIFAAHRYAATQPTVVPGAAVAPVQSQTPPPPPGH
jgi:hypothetical protein